MPLTKEPSNSMESFVMREENIAPSALKRPDDEVRRIEEVDPTDMAARCQHDQSVHAHNAFLITVHQIANDFAVGKRCARSKPPT